MEVSKHVSSNVYKGPLSRQDHINDPSGPDGDSEGVEGRPKRQTGTSRTWFTRVPGRPGLGDSYVGRHRRNVIGVLTGGTEDVRFGDPEDRGGRHSPGRRKVGRLHDWSGSVRSPVRDSNLSLEIWDGYDTKIGPVRNERMVTVNLVRRPPSTQLLWFPRPRGSRLGRGCRSLHLQPC